MIPLYSTEQIRLVDDYAIKQMGIPGPVLMENASVEIYRHIEEKFLKGDKEKKIGFVCGKGNNGGDGFVVARHCVNNGYNVKILFLGSEEELSEDCKINYRIISDYEKRFKGVSLKRFSSVKDINRLRDCSIIVDAMLGSGAKGELREPYKSIVEKLNDLKASRVAIDIPTGLDADTGFGGPSEVKETVRAFERAGVAGIQIEDQKPVTKKCGHLAGKEVISAKAMGEKIKAACRARRDKDFLIIARTDARGVNGFNDAVKRAKVYADAGADVIFPEALESKDEFKEFAKLVDESLMANMTEFGKTPYISIREFREMGYSIVLFPMTVFRIGMKAMEEALIELKRKETQKGLLRKMQTRKELYKLLGYEK